MPLVLPVAIEPDDVGVLELPEDVEFALETLLDGLVGRVGLADDLDCHQLAGFFVLGPENRAHGAGADFLIDDVGADCFAD